MISIRYLLAASIVLGASCTGPRQQPPSGNQNMANPADVRTWLDVIERGAWGEWKGLDGTWSRSNLASIGGGLRSCRAHELSGKPVQRCELSLARQPQPLQCFFAEDGQVLLLRLEDPKSADAWPALAQKLGPPDQTNLVPREHVRAPSTQYIYGARGITLYVLEVPDAAQSVPMAVSLYAPASAQTYRQALGGDETIEYFDDPGLP
jgi:hypothetical protein